MNSDVLVIGAGPIGLMTAIGIAERGYKVTILEEHSKVGVPCHCPGLVSVNGIRRLKLHSRINISSCVENHIYGAYIHSPSDYTFLLSSKSIKAYVIDRVELERKLAKIAELYGCEIRLNTHAKRFLYEYGYVKGVKCESNTEYRANLVVNCEGSSFKLLAQIGYKPPLFVKAAQAYLLCRDLDEKYVHLYFNDKIAPGFFAYAIPRGEGVVTVGLGSKLNNPFPLLSRFIKKNFKGYKISRLSDGRIVIGGPISKTYADGLLLVGDVAGHSKPTTGGGLITGGLCAKLAAETAVRALESGDVSMRTLRNFQKAWKRVLGAEYQAMKLARKVYNLLTDKVRDSIFRAIGSSDLRELIEEVGDMDFQRRTLLAIMKSPLFIPSVVKAVVGVS